MKHHTTASLLALAALAQASPLLPASNTATQHIPVVRRRATTLTPDQIGAAGDRLRAKYGFPTVASRQQKRAGQTVGVGITNEVRATGPLGDSPAA
jgi:cathepsin D